jgi:predicted RNA-binding protein with PUA-like domain
MPQRGRGFWLLKSEPSTFSFDDLWKSKGRRTLWDGIRNHQARNFLRDAMRIRDGVLFYHSSADPTGVAGIAEIASAAEADPSQFDPASPKFDPASSRAAPTWLAVGVRAIARLPRVVTLEELRSSRSLSQMGVLQRGNRLSVQPVTPREWAAVLALAGVQDPRAKL